MKLLDQMVPGKPVYLHVPNKENFNQPEVDPDIVQHHYTQEDSVIEVRLSEKDDKEKYPYLLKALRGDVGFVIRSGRTNLLTLSLKEGGDRYVTAEYIDEVLKDRYIVYHEKWQVPEPKQKSES